MRLWVTAVFLAAALEGARSQELVESGGDVKKPGDSLRLSCKASGFTFSSYWMHWLRQAPGKGLEWIGEIHPSSSSINYAQAFKGRFTISRDNPNNLLHLQVTGLMPEDTARYYCARSRRATGFDYWGQGTMVTVTSADPKSPSVFPLTSCPGEATSSQVTFGCLVDGYTPEPVKVQWSPAVGSEGVKTYPSMLHSSSGLYSLSSQVTVSDSSWQSNTYRCTVEHEPTKSSISKEIPSRASTTKGEEREGVTETVTTTGREETPSSKPHPPTVQVYHSSCTTKPSTIHLLCLISGFSPMPLKVEWLVDGVSGQLQGNTAPAKKDAGGQTFSTHSNASVSQEEFMEDKTYTCRVFHPGTGTTEEGEARKCKDVPTSTSNILVFMVPPSPAELYVGQSPMLTCLVINLPNDADLKVVWSREKPGTISPEPIALSEQRNRTFTASSSLAIFPRDWESGEKYTCKVEHSELPSPIIRSISKKQGKSSPPRVYLLRPHPDELSNNGDTVSLTCLVRGFFPEDISVKWMEGSQSSDSNKSVTTSPMKEREGDSTYFLYSKMTVDKANWNSGTTYTCMVIHQALTPLKFTQRNIRNVPEVIVSGEFCTEDGDEDLNSLWSTISVFITLFLLSVCYSATVTLFKVKWLFATVVQLKRVSGPEYKNVIQRVV